LKSIEKDKPTIFSFQKVTYIYDRTIMPTIPVTITGTTVQATTSSSTHKAALNGSCPKGTQAHLISKFLEVPLPLGLPHKINNAGA